ncbi:MAG: GGDEF domain-containing protein [Candidatus Eisenbacteria bacterium]
MGNIDYARLLREVLPVHLLDETIRRVVEESLSEGSEASLHGASALVLEALAAKGLFAREDLGRSAEGAVTYHDRRGLVRVTLCPPEPPAPKYRFDFRPILAPEMATEETKRALEEVLTGAASESSDDELGDALRRIAAFLGVLLPAARVRFISLADPPPSTPFEPAERSVLAAPFREHFRRGGDPLYVPDLALDLRLAARAEAEEARSAAALPLRAGEETFGVLEVLHAETDAFDENKRGALSLVALLAAGRIRSAKHFEKMVYIDLLTGVFTRRFFEEQILRELERAGRENTPLALVMVDLDNFKEVNDRFGHPTGDLVLARVAEILRDHVRRIDLVTRYGGEEFAILLPGASREQVKVICERLRALVQDASIPAEGEKPFRLTTSIGIALHPENTTAGRETAETRRELLERADQALYAAKRAGKNRVIFWEGEAGP